MMLKLLRAKRFRNGWLIVMRSSTAHWTYWRTGNRRDGADHWVVALGYLLVEYVRLSKWHRGLDVEEET